MIQLYLVQMVKMDFLCLDTYLNKKKTVLVVRSKNKNIINLQKKYKEFAYIKIIKNFNSKNYKNFLKKIILIKFIFFLDIAKFLKTKLKKKNVF